MRCPALSPHSARTQRGRPWHWPYLGRVPMPAHPQEVKSPLSTGKAWGCRAPEGTAPQRPASPSATWRLFASQAKLHPASASPQLSRTDSSMSRLSSAKSPSPSASRAVGRTSVGPRLDARGGTGGPRRSSPSSRPDGGGAGPRQGGGGAAGTQRPCEASVGRNVQAVTSGLPKGAGVPEGQPRAAQWPCNAAGCTPCAATGSGLPGGGRRQPPGSASQSPGAPCGCCHSNPGGLGGGTGICGGNGWSAAGRPCQDAESATCFVAPVKSAPGSRFVGDTVGCSISSNSFPLASCSFTGAWSICSNILPRITCSHSGRSTSFDSPARVSVSAAHLHMPSAIGVLAGG
mmetsp:Transcript_7407/g.23244  ORF Transcript_7407/g.23244 Transcript_7407/m.23244 type:complete len:346 (-) Transcript_7407:64-1101(-)